MVPTKDLLQMKGYTQTGSEGMEKEYPCKWKTKKKKSCGSYTFICQKRLEDRYCMRDK